MDNKQKPVTDDFYEELETAAALGKPCEIVFRSENGSRTVIRDRIATVYTGEDRAFLKTGSGLEISLDKLIQVDGKPNSNYC
jgi:hypothetical protein